MRLLSLEHEVAAYATFSARDRHLMRLRSIVRGIPTCGRRLMRLPPTHDRPSVLPGPSVYSMSCLFIGEGIGSRVSY
ncbi:hypothetical protein B296_00035955 [Ensete ventricosum]|uniref:Uncharacterized protein n=1 Tax=Ensete ventricosum TaxID=4639 RepID=A0A426X9P1_ENSVE|nr:hypothetical protein B296_00035955 [Ensete ventricosum]